MKAVLVSTYDLGRQPFGVASAAAWLARAGADVRCVDLAVEPFDPIAFEGADLVALYLPMHTAARLAARFLPAIRRAAPGARLCCFGLYAALNGESLLELGADAATGGEFEAVLADQMRPEAEGGVRTVLDRQRFLIPLRKGLPALDGYAHLVMPDGTRRVAGATQTSRGCLHRCRHCPVVPVYGGTLRIVQREVVLADVDNLVEAGAGHVTFADPDFFNAPTHSLRIVEEMHRRHPRLSYDVTIKVEHLLRYRRHLDVLKRTGCLFVTTAVESFDDAVLARLEKGHTGSEAVAAVGLLRAAGLGVKPTFIPFHPWTTRSGYAAFLARLAELKLVDDVPPVQLSLRLLITRRSRLLELPEIRRISGPFDPQALVHPWRHPDPDVDEMQRAAAAIAREAAAAGVSPGAVFERFVRLAEGAVAAAGEHTEAPRRAKVPYLEEPWYC
ncbi:MAG: radical SAM protein [Acidobacteria bacterium]|nr:MAG: radical SAM protein [Acidobacteriota bacterium]